MPGSYRSITTLLKAPKVEQVKLPEQDVSVSQSESVEEVQDASDGKWTLQQNLKFAIFVHYYENIFASKRKRKLCKIFKSQAEYLDKRTPTQCRSHFQKMMAKFKSIARMKKYYKSTFGNEAYAKEFQDFKNVWEENHQPLDLLHPELKETKEISIQTEPLEQRPTLCNNCSNRNENQQQGFSPYSPFQFNQMNPYIYWPNGSQNEINPLTLMMWMQNLNQQGNS